MHGPGTPRHGLIHFVQRALTQRGVTKEVAMLEKKRTFFVIVFLLVFVFSGSAYALKFTGNAWVAQHLTAGEPTDEYFLVIDNSQIGNLHKVKLKGLKLKTASSVPDFYALTGNAGNEVLTYFEIDVNSKYFRNLGKKA